MAELKKKDGKNIAIGVGIVAVIGGAILLFRKDAQSIPPEDIVLSDLQIEPSEVFVGEQVVISVVATNIGGVAGSYEVNVEVV